jgi:hypothetical protein
MAVDSSVKPVVVENCQDNIKPEQAATPVGGNNVIDGADNVVDGADNVVDG